jgi:hypothetical protein
MTRLLALALIMVLLSACNDQGFGYKQNPLRVLRMAHKAIIQGDDEKLGQYLSLEAKCLYANPQGLALVQAQLSDKIKNYKSELTLLSKKFNQSPRFVGYWSYYNEVYKIDISEKNEEQTMVASIKVTCDFGFKGVRELQEATRRSIENMPIKMCKIQKMRGHLIDEMPISEDCRSLQVSF